MKAAIILVPLALALASAGAVMLYVAQKPEAPVPIISSDFHVRHPVTEAMIRETGEMKAKPAPFFKLEDVHGIPVQLGGAGKKPQFVYFVLKGCPCSIEAQPLFNKMYDRYKDKVDFIAVMSSKPAEVKNYAGEMTVLGPMVSDPDLKIVKAYGAVASVYSALVKPNGAIEKMYPGYSVSMLTELNEKLAQMTETKLEKFDASLAPKEYASGCAF